uniref:Uncharacterized protein n=1 Tax=Anguilla anguilla TaxID=7936 RepID=A0A0E9SXE5_ANGAN
MHFNYSTVQTCSYPPFNYRRERVKRRQSKMGDILGNQRYKILRDNTNIYSIYYNSDIYKHISKPYNFNL